MQNLGDRRIDDYITFGVQLHRFSSGAVYAPTGSVTYTFYENNSTSGAPTGGNLAQLNSKTGLYSARVQLTTAAGFEAGKDYFVHVEATVDSVAAGELFSFRVVDVPTVDVTKIAGSAVSTSSAQLGVNVVNFGGSAGTFASGRPETNTSHIAGSAVSTSTAQLGVNVVNFGGSAGTFASGRPEVNASHLAGTAYGSADLSATMKTSVTTACTASTPTAAAVTGAVGSVTGNVGGNVTGSVGSVVGAVGSVTGAVGSVTGNVGGNVTGSVGSLATQAKADVNAEVLDVLNVDTFAEPAQGTPGATISLAAKIGYLYKAFRNRKAQTATTKSIYNDDATTVDHKCTVADDGTTYSETEMTTGP